MNQAHTYLCIDLKSFYASVECVERDLNPLSTNLVVADSSRTTKTICLAVSPSLKAIGIPGRPRLFEVIQKVKEENRRRRDQIRTHQLTHATSDANELNKHPEYELDFIIAPPRMAYYIEYSTKIYQIYLKYVAKEDIHVYSIDEAFIDLTPYLKTAKLTAHEFAMQMIQDVLRETGITATAGIGTNMYLAKVAMDIVAKHLPADKDGVRIAELDEMSYRYHLWNHRPLTDFWRVGKGISKKLEQYGLYTMGDVALCSANLLPGGLNNEFLYHLFGINAELLIDHAWGIEPTTIADIKRYEPSSRSLGSGQVLHEPYDSKKGELIVKEMADQLALNLVAKRVVADQIVLTIGYDTTNVTNPELNQYLVSEIKEDRYGRKIPLHAHGTMNLPIATSSSEIFVRESVKLYHKIINPHLLIRRVNIVANHIKSEDLKAEQTYEQLSLFEAPKNDEALSKKALEKEHKIQDTLISIKQKYGKNAVLKGMNLEEGATTKERNEEIGGHRA